MPTSCGFGSRDSRGTTAGLSVFSPDGGADTGGSVVVRGLRCVVVGFRLAMPRHFTPCHAANRSRYVRRLFACLTVTPATDTPCIDAATDAPTTQSRK